jgi:transposase
MSSPGELHIGEWVGHVCSPPTQAYVQRRTQQGLSKKEILRCLKRYIARQLYRFLLALSVNPSAPSNAS